MAMTDSYKDPEQRSQRSDGNRGGFRGGRNNSGNREGGGFRIRLSDNEMRSARALQEAFGLRSTVAVLGFALRTLGQMLDEGSLVDLISKYQEQNTQKSRRRDDSERWSKTSRSENQKFQARPDPFARPSKPEKTSLHSEEVKNNEEEKNTANETDQTITPHGNNTSDIAHNGEEESQSTPQEELKASSSEA